MSAFLHHMLLIESHPTQFHNHPKGAQHETDDGGEAQHYYLQRTHKHQSLSCRSYGRSEVEDHMVQGNLTVRLTTRLVEAIE